MSAPTIETRGDLDALPSGTIIRNSLNEAVSKYGADWFFPGIRHRFTNQAIGLPAVVLWSPDLEAQVQA